MLLMQELDWQNTLGLASTWPQAGGVLPSREPGFDWQGTRPLRLPRQDLIIYEMHIRGFTQSPSSGTSCPGVLTCRAQSFQLPAKMNALISICYVTALAGFKMWVALKKGINVAKLISHTQCSDSKQA